MTSNRLNPAGEIIPGVSGHANLSDGERLPLAGRHALDTVVRLERAVHPEHHDGAEFDWA